MLSKFLAFSGFPNEYRTIIILKNGRHQPSVINYTSLPAFSAVIFTDRNLVQKCSTYIADKVISLF